MIDPRVITGQPGTRWRNPTPLVFFQLRCSLIRTCGRCLQFHGMIAPHWNLPFHRNCRCTVAVVAPYADSPFPFADFLAILNRMPEAQKTAAIGASNYRLLHAGLVQWDDIVTPERVRSLAEVVARNGLTVAAMVAAGVLPAIARRAYEAALGGATAATEAHYRDLFARLGNAVMGHTEAAAHVGRILGAAGSAVAPVPKAPSRHIADLTALLAAVPRRRDDQLDPDSRKLVAAELGDDAARSVRAFLAAADAAIGGGRTLAPAVMVIYQKYAGAAQPAAPKARATR